MPANCEYIDLPGSYLPFTDTYVANVANLEACVDLIILMTRMIIRDDDDDDDDNDDNDDCVDNNDECGDNDDLQG